MASNIFGGKGDIKNGNGKKTLMKRHEDLFLQNQIVSMLSRSNSVFLVVVPESNWDFYCNLLGNWEFHFTFLKIVHFSLNFSIFFCVILPVFFNTSIFCVIFSLYFECFRNSLHNTHTFPGSFYKLRCSSKTFQYKKWIFPQFFDFPFHFRIYSYFFRM